MLTLFSVPRAFDGHIGVIQRNAIRSWMYLQPKVQIVLLGDEPGTEVMAREIGAYYVPDVARNENGTPLLDSVWKWTKKVAKFPYFAHINADAIILNDFLESVQHTIDRFPEFLLASLRWNVKIEDEINFDECWQARLKSLVDTTGHLQQAWGADHFVFRHDFPPEMPPFAVGRCYYDTWMLWKARQLEIPLIDMTYAAQSIHQMHNYSHAGGIEFEMRGPYMEHPEVKQNCVLAGGTKNLRYLRDASHVLLRQTEDTTKLVLSKLEGPQLTPVLGFGGRKKKSDLLGDF